MIGDLTYLEFVGTTAGGIALGVLILWLLDVLFNGR
jgi:hypothetical protein